MSEPRTEAKQRLWDYVCDIRGMGDNGELDEMMDAIEAHGLDVDRLTTALWGIKWDADARRFAEKIAAKYARVGQ